MARAIIHLIATALALEETALDRHFANPTTFLRLLRYPTHPAAAGDDQFRLGAAYRLRNYHAVGAGREAAVSQVRRRDGGWIDTAPLRGDLRA